MEQPRQTVQTWGQAACTACVDPPSEPELTDGGAETFSCSLSIRWAPRCGWLEAVLQYSGGWENVFLGRGCSRSLVCFRALSPFVFPLFSPSALTFFLEAS